MSYGGEPATGPGAALYAERTGDGPPLVFLHGFGVNSAVWKPWIGGLRGSHELFLVDLKGSGRSSKPDDGRYSPVDQAELVVDFMRDQGLRGATLIGHSLGGGVALLAALILKEQGDEATLARLVSIGGAAYPQPLPPFATMAQKTALARAALRIVPKGWLIRTVRRSVMHNNVPGDPEVVGSFAAALESPEAQRALLDSARQIEPNDLDRWTGRYPDLDLPTLLLWGRQDRVVPLWVAERLDRELPASSLVVLESCGHLPMEEAPATSLKAVTEFLARTD